MNFCPLAVDWGDIAAWVSAIVALFVGVAVYRLGSRTHQLELAVVNGSSSQMEQQRRALMTAVLPELEVNSACLQNMAALTAYPDFARLAAEEAGTPARFWYYISKLRFRHYDRLLDRAHLLLPEHAGVLARSYAFLQVLEDLAAARSESTPQEIADGIHDMGPRLLSLAKGFDAVSADARQILRDIEHKAA